MEDKMCTKLRVIPEEEVQIEAMNDGRMYRMDESEELSQLCKIRINKLDDVLLYLADNCLLDEDLTRCENLGHSIRRFVEEVL